MQVLIFATDS